jgi:steroid 5-alpha reductase family enzyme
MSESPIVAANIRQAYNCPRFNVLSYYAVFVFAACILLTLGFLITISYINEDIASTGIASIGIALIVFTVLIIVFYNTYLQRIGLYLYTRVKLPDQILEASKST